MPETVAPARRDPPEPMAAPPARARRRPRRRALAAAPGQDIELPGQHLAEMIIAELAASLGHTHAQAVITLARRRIDVLWALLRDDRTFSIDPPSLAAAA